MMKTIKRSIAIITLIIFTMLLAGCELGDVFSFWALKKSNPPKKIESIISEPDNLSAQKVISDYFNALYKGDPVEYAQNAMEGNIPAGVESFITADTIKLSEGNPEMPIHLPRFVELNGKTITSYSIEEYEGKTVEAELVTTVGEADSYLYYVKVFLSCVCLDNDAFDKLYEYNDETGIYEEPEEEPEATTTEEDEEEEDPVDNMRVMAKYDVVVKKDGSGFKIVSAKEINDILVFTRRNHKLNNDFLKRITWLDYKDTDKNLYTKEKGVVESFVNDMFALDSADIGLVRSGWNEDAEKFKEALERLSFGSAGKLLLEEVDDEDLEGAYQLNFPIEEFPVSKDIESISKHKIDETKPNVSYSPKNIEYFVRVEATVSMKNKIPMGGKKYVYDYDVKLEEDESGKYVIKSFRLEQKYEDDDNKKADDKK